MLYIPWNKEADPWYQFGQAVGNGLGLLAENRDARGAAKDKQNAYADYRVSQLNQQANTLNEYNNVLNDPNATDDDKTFARFNAQRFLPDHIVGSTPESVKTLLGGIQDQSNYIGQYKDKTKGLWLHDPNRQHVFDYIDAYKPKGLMGGV